MRHPLAPTLAAAVALAAVACAAVACGGTEGELVRIDVALAGDTDGAERVTSAGWTVRLDEARLVLGPVYAYAPEEAALHRRLERALVGRALAHGGVDPLSGRRVRAEVTEPLALDLLAPGGVRRAGLEAEAGPVDAVTLVLDAPAGALAAPTRGHQAWVAGEARRDGATVRFEGGLDLPATELGDRVEDVAANVTVAAGGTLRIVVHASRWLDEADFAALAPDVDGVARLGPGDPVRNAWFLAVRSARGYSVEWAEQEETR